MADDMFLGLPPPSAKKPSPPQVAEPKITIERRHSPTPAPIIKSVLKRDKPSTDHPKTQGKKPKHIFISISSSLCCFNGMFVFETQPHLLF